MHHTQIHIVFHSHLSLRPVQDVPVITNARREAHLLNPRTGQYLELDIYLPSLYLAFEYQV